METESVILKRTPREGRVTVKRAVTLWMWGGLYYIWAVMGAYKSGAKWLAREVTSIGMWLLYDSAHCVYGYPEFSLL